MPEVKEVIERLRNCPCCDGKMHLGADYDGDPMWSHPSDEDEACPLGVVAIYACDDKAIAAWNRRAPDPERDELREALRPFAEAWIEIERIYAKHGVSCEPADEVLVRSRQFTHGEYRRASRLLAGKGVKG